MAGIKKPAAKKPAAKKPAAKKPAAKKPAAKKVVAKKPVVKKPAAKKVVAKKPAVKKPRAKKDPVVDRNAEAKAAATAAKEPWVSVLTVELDIDNIGNGAFDLDWNDYFVAKLARAGYKGTDVDMVDAWFADICRNVLAQNWEQEMADPDKRAANERKK